MVLVELETWETSFHAPTFDELVRCMLENFLKI
jgi:hypothetical protein